MYSRLLLSLVSFLFVTSFSWTQEVQVFDTYDEFKSILEQDDDKIHVVNFWATWCAPCIKELPYLQELEKELGSDKVELTLVSLDFADLLDSRVKPFIKKKNITSKVVLLDDPKSSVWIDLVDKSWSGAIPATVFYYKGNRQFHEIEFHSTDELKGIISSLTK